MCMRAVHCGRLSERDSGDKNNETETPLADHYWPCDRYAFRYFRRLESMGWFYPGLDCAVKVIACIENPMVIEKILTHLNEKAASAATGLLLQVQAPPQAGLFD